MPKEFTHILFADALLDDLGQTGHGDPASLLGRHRSILHFGSIATDTLYYEVTFPVIDRDYAHWGEIIHGGRGEDTGTPIREMLRRLLCMVLECRGSALECRKDALDLAVLLLPLPN